jgi:tetratricopeptide (TPR) repeat protein
MSPEGDPVRAKAVPAFKKAQELAKDRGEASILEAHAALASKDYPRAIEAASRAVQSSERWEAWLVRAMARRRGPRDGKAALADSLEAIRRQRSHPGVVEVACQLTYFTGGFDECRRHCDALLRLRGQDYAPAYIRRCWCNYQQQRDTEALADAETAVRIAAKCADSFIARSTVLNALGRVDDALRDADEAVRLSPTSASAYNTRAIIRMARKDYAAAIPDLDKAVGADSNMAGAWFNRGQCHRQLKQSDKALPDYRRANEIDPGNANYFTFLMSCWVADLKDYNGALDFMSRPNAQFPNDQLVLFWAARAQIGLKQYEAALTNLDNALRLSPNSFDCLRWKAHALYYLKRLDEATRDIEQATKLAPQEAELWSDRAIMMREAKRWQDAIDSANRAIQLRAAFKERLEPVIKFCQEQLK